MEEVPKIMKWVVAIATLALWLVLVVFGILTLVSNWPPEQKFFSLTEKVLLPLLKLTIVAVLSYVFGTPVADGLARRLSK